VGSDETTVGASSITLQREGARPSKKKRKREGKGAWGGEGVTEEPMGNKIWLVLDKKKGKKRNNRKLAVARKLCSSSRQGRRRGVKVDRNTLPAPRDDGGWKIGIELGTIRAIGQRQKKGRRRKAKFFR